MTTTEQLRPEAGSEDQSPRQTLGSAFRDYLTKVRGGDVGALPAVLGFIFLVILFSVLRPENFATRLNWANLLGQSAAVIFIAMGLIFVLLLGEIDLAAGYTAGVAAGVLAVLMTLRGWPWPIAVGASLLTGVLIGLLIGLLVARLGIPSFVVTLAAFLALQGVLLTVIGTGGTVPIRNEFVLALMNNNIPPVGGWIMWAVVVGGYALVVLFGLRQRKAAGLPVGSPVVPLLRVVVLAVLLGAVVYLLNLERAINPAIKSLKGVPLIVPIAVAFVVVLTFVLTKTRFGRHVYAVGGNAEAARRSGINVNRVKIACFVISSSLAAFGGILLASRANSVSPSTGGASTLLLAVGAAVIGGTSLFGGKGRILDAVIGGLVIAVIQNGLPLITQRAEIQFIVTGLVLLLAASVDAISRRRAAATGR
jgi:D-xylose transport system permease protein